MSKRTQTEARGAAAAQKGETKRTRLDGDATIAVTTTTATTREPKRCHWSPVIDGEYRRYHDEEWGVPVHDDTKLFEMITLEGAQAGLSWVTILKKRDAYREAFYNFAIPKVAAMTASDIERLLLPESRIVRNRAKVVSTVENAKRVLEIQKEFGSLDKYIWSYAPPPRASPLKSMSDLPVTCKEAEALSEDMKRRGMKFVGPTILYSFFQAVGVVDDHVEGCFRCKSGGDDE